MSPPAKLFLYVDDIIIHQDSDANKENEPPYPRGFEEKDWDALEADTSDNEESSKKKAKIDEEEELAAMYAANPSYYRYLLYANDEENNEANNDQEKNITQNNQKHISTSSRPTTQPIPAILDTEDKDDEVLFIEEIITIRYDDNYKPPQTKPSSEVKPTATTEEEKEETD